MENGLNFGKAIEAAKAGKEWQEQDGTGRNVRIVPASQYPAITGALKNWGELCTLSRILGS
jgi:hypothetical protein